MPKIDLIYFCDFPFFKKATILNDASIDDRSIIHLTNRCAPPDMLLKTREIFDRSVEASSIFADLPRLVRRIEIKTESDDQVFTIGDMEKVLFQFNFNFLSSFFSNFYFWVYFFSIFFFSPFWTYEHEGTQRNC